MTACWEGRTKQLAALLFLFLVISLSSCEKKEDTVGADFVGSRTPFDLQSDESMDLVAYTTRLDSVSTRNEYLTYYSLGTFNDASIGSTQSNVFCQYSLSSPNFRFASVGSGFHIDSVVLQLSYAFKDGYYGKTDQNQQIRVYELNEKLSSASDSFYFSNREYAVGTTVLGEFNGSFSSIGDSVSITLGTKTSKVAPHLRIRIDAIDPAIKQRMLDANAGTNTAFTENSSFQSLFKGLAIVSGASSGEGCIAYLNMKSAVTSVVVYYNDSLRQDFPISANSMYTNQYRHSYNGNIVINPLNSGTHTDVNYIQALNGLKTKIMMPSLFNIVKDKKIAVAGAEMVIPIQSGSDLTYKPPTVAYLVANDSLGRKDLTFLATPDLGNIYYGGTYNASKKEYRFNMMRYFQKTLNAYQKGTQTKNYGFSLYIPQNIPNPASRAIVDTRKGRMKLILTYNVIK